MAYAWSKFKQEVGVLITVEQNRVGAEDYVGLMLRQACINLQSHIPAYRLGHETLYAAVDLVREGAAMRGVLPPQAQVRDAFIVHPDEASMAARRHGLLAFDWQDRMSLVHGQVAVNDGQGHICIDPQGYTFYLYPALEGDDLLSLFWDGVKLDSFLEDEETPFDEGAVMAVADFVKGKCAREFQGDLALHNSFMISFANQRRELLLDASQRSNLK